MFEDKLTFYSTKPKKLFSLERKYTGLPGRIYNSVQKKINLELTLFLVSQGITNSLNSHEVTTLAS